MKRRRLIRGLIAVVALAVVGTGASWTGTQPGKRWTARSLDRQILKDADARLSPDGAKKWFKRQGIACSQFDGTSGDALKIDDRVVDMAEIAGVDPGRVCTTVRGHLEWPQADVGFLQFGHIWVYFYFNCNGDLLNYYVRKEVTST